MKQINDFLTVGNILDAWTVIQAEIDLKSVPPNFVFELDGIVKLAKKSTEPVALKQYVESFCSRWEMMTKMNIKRKSGLDIYTDYQTTPEGQRIVDLFKSE